MSDTRRRLLDAAITVLRDKGIAGASARVIAATAGVNQALVFYHFGSVDGLIDAACRAAAAEHVERYRPQFRAVTSFGGLLALGQQLHTQQRRAGNITVLAQVLAGARHHPRLAASAQHALTLWVAEIETTLDRLLPDSPVAALVSTTAVARAVAAAFIGIELYEGADPQGAASAFAAIQQLSALIDLPGEPGPRRLPGSARPETPRGPAQAAQQNPPAEPLSTTSRPVEVNRASADCPAEGRGSPVRPHSYP